MNAASVGLQSAVFGGGCFWCVEAVFASLEGVHSAQSGYCGGSVDQPTYEQVCSNQTGHIEVVKIDFDPAKISYKDLLEVLFATARRSCWRQADLSALGRLWQRCLSSPCLCLL